MKDITLVFLAIVGSKLYGLDDENSDTDVRGVCLDTIDGLIGLEEFEQFTPDKDDAFHSILKSEFDIVSDDVQIYGLRKFFRLMLENNPNILEFLFADNLCELPNHMYHIWELVIKNKHLFLSEKIRHTFAGYAYSQLHRIKNHKRWIDNPPIKPDPMVYGMVLTEKGGQKWTDSNLKNSYESKIKDYNSYLSWMMNRNPKRKELETKFGYDTKHAMHLWRLVLEAQELLITGNLRLPLSDDVRKHLINIKDGRYTYQQIIQSADTAINQLSEIKTDLPHKPDHKGANELLIQIYKDYLCQ